MSRSMSSGERGEGLDVERIEFSQRLTRQNPIIDESRRNHPSVMSKNESQSLDVMTGISSGIEEGVGASGGLSALGVDDADGVGHATTSSSPSEDWLPRE